MPLSPKIMESRIQYALRSFQERGFTVFEPAELIKKAIDEFGDSLAVACSFGRCSTVVLSMALALKPDIKIVFHNTGVQYPETYAYRDHLLKEWDLNPPQYIETKPVKSFWQCVKEYGFPLESRTQRGSPGKPKCCVYLKEKPFRKAQKEHEIEAILTGIRVIESRVRMFIIGQRGQYYLSRKFGKVWKFHPISFWTDNQIEAYYQHSGIPKNPLYLKGIERSGCMPCTGFKTWKEQLAKYNPRMYRYIQRLRGVSLLDDYISLENEAVDKCGQRLLEEWF